MEEEDGGRGVGVEQENHSFWGPRPFGKSNAALNLTQGVGAGSLVAPHPTSRPTWSQVAPGTLPLG